MSFLKPNFTKYRKIFRAMAEPLPRLEMTVDRGSQESLLGGCREVVVRVRHQQSTSTSHSRHSSGWPRMLLSLSQAALAANRYTAQDIL